MWLNMFLVSGPGWGTTPRSIDISLQARGLLKIFKWKNPGRLELGGWAARDAGKKCGDRCWPGSLAPRQWRPDTAPAPGPRQTGRGWGGALIRKCPYYTELLTLSLEPILALISVFCDLSVSVRVTWPPAPPVTHCAINLAGGAF